MIWEIVGGLLLAAGGMAVVELVDHLVSGTYVQPQLGGDLDREIAIVAGRPPRVSRDVLLELHAGMDCQTCGLRSEKNVGTSVCVPQVGQTLVNVSER